MFNRKKYMKKWREDNPEYMEKYRITNKDRIKKQVKICYEKWYKNNPSYMKKYMRNYDRKEYTEKYRKGDILKIRGYRKEYNKNIIGERYKTDIKFKLNSLISGAIRRALKGNKAGKKWESIVGYTLINLINHLKKTMPKNYTWQDFLDGRLHIDHKIPISAFNFTQPEHTDFKKCWALKNLQLLPAKDNLSKSNKLTKPFQPALQI